SMVHIKDFYLRSTHPGEGWMETISGNYLRGAIIGHGDINMKEVIKIVKNSGYDGYLSVEFEGMEECKHACKISLDNVRRIWNEI
ncbi:TIM barrel protein, partial [Micrococcus sp. SIMBA_144]